MSRYIDADHLKMVIESGKPEKFPIETQWKIESLISLEKSANFHSRPNSKWERLPDDDDFYFDTYLFCPVCGKSFGIEDEEKGLWNYCPNCGTFMS